MLSYLIKMHLFLYTVETYMSLLQKCLKFQMRHLQWYFQNGSIQTPIPKFNLCQRTEFTISLVNPAYRGTETISYLSPKIQLIKKYKNCDERNRKGYIGQKEDPSYCCTWCLCRKLCLAPTKNLRKSRKILIYLSTANVTV